MQWTTDQVLTLAPDAGSASAGRGLGEPRKWLSLGKSAVAVWGECQGSGKQPYQTRVELSEPAFQCSCPSRKFPCKHALGLLLVLAQRPEAVPVGEAPAWVTEWLAARGKRAEQRAERAEKATTVTDTAAAARRAASRQAKVTAGLAELEQWLADLMRRGLASIQGEGYAFWERPAARLVDAQAPGLARQVRAMAGLSATGTGWTERLLDHIGRLHLLIEGYRRLDELPAAVQADIREQIGWTQSQDELLTQAGRRDEWLIIGHRLEHEERLRIRRSWLWGRGGGQLALVLDFAHGSEPFKSQLLLGQGIEAELVFYPGAYPLRAVIKERSGLVDEAGRPAGYPTIAAAVSAYTRALALNPWLMEFPLLLEEVWPLPADDGWVVVDRSQHQLRLSPAETIGWQLLALSGGQPVMLFGEWDGDSLRPLRVWHADGSLALTALEG